MKTVVITGSARGFGFEMAKEFRLKNYNVMLSDLNLENLENAKNELLNIPSQGDVSVCVANVTKYEDMENLWSEAAKTFKTVDVWINNAGVNQRDLPIMELSKDELDFVLNVDLHGTVYGSQVAFKNMHKQGFGAIYNVEGYGSNDAMMMGLTMYGTSKRAITYFTQALAKESKTLNSPVIVGRITPGIMITNFLTTANGKNNEITLSEKTKKVYNILGDYPETIAKFTVEKIVKNKKNNAQFTWLTGTRAFCRFLTASFKKRNLFND